MRAIHRAFTLVEIMIVMLILAILMAIAVPNMTRARARSQQQSCIETLEKIEDAKEIMAMQRNLSNGDPVTGPDLWPEYIKAPVPPTCPAGGIYTLNVIGTPPVCSISGGSHPHVAP